MTFPKKTLEPEIFKIKTRDDENEKAKVSNGKTRLWKYIKIS